MVLEVELQKQSFDVDFISLWEEVVVLEVELQKQSFDVDFISLWVL